jgi:opacity protein-like surface antigen
MGCFSGLFPFCTSFPARRAVVLAVALLLCGSFAAHGQGPARGRQSNTKIGLNRVNLSGATYTLAETAGTTEVSNSDALTGNEVFLEYIFFGRIGLEFTLGLTEMQRSYELSSGGTTISNVEESARSALLGLNLYFSDHASPGIKTFFGLGSGVVSVDHSLRGGTLGTQSSSVAVQVNTLKLGLDWIKENSGLRVQVLSQTGEDIDTQAIAGYTQTVDYTATGLSIGVFAFF